MTDFNTKAIRQHLEDIETFESQCDDCGERAIDCDCAYEKECEIADHKRGLMQDKETDQ